jgi:hypothetical protein
MLAGIVVSICGLKCRRCEHLWASDLVISIPVYQHSWEFTLAGICSWKNMWAEMVVQHSCGPSFRSCEYPRAGISVSVLASSFGLVQS